MSTTIYIGYEVPIKDGVTLEALQEAARSEYERLRPHAADAVGDRWRKESWADEAERAFNGEGEEWGPENDLVDEFMHFLAPFTEKGIATYDEGGEEFGRYVFDGKGKVCFQRGWKAYGSVLGLFEEEYAGKMSATMRAELAKLKKAQGLVTSLEDS